MTGAAPQFRACYNKRAKSWWIQDIVLARGGSSAYVAGPFRTKALAEAALNERLQGDED